jgi:hypothetical protein
MLLWRIFGPKGEEIIGGWTVLHDEIINLYSSSTYYSKEIKQYEMIETCSTNGIGEKCIQN